MAKMVIIPIVIVLILAGGGFFGWPALLSELKSRQFGEKEAEPPFLEKIKLAWENLIKRMAEVGELVKNTNQVVQTKIKDKLAKASKKIQDLARFGGAQITPLEKSITEIEEEQPLTVKEKGGGIQEIEEISEEAKKEEEEPRVGQGGLLSPTPGVGKPKLSLEEIQEQLDDISERIDILNQKITKLLQEKGARLLPEEKKEEEKKEERVEEEEKKESEELEEKEIVKKEEESCSPNSININTASAAELKKITGIGPVLSQRIIEARPFSSLNDLLRVKGIGEVTLQKIIAQGCAYVEPIYFPGGGGQPPSYPKILISEVQISPIDQRFIELYNPNDQDINLTGWYLQRKTATATSWTSFITSTQFEGKIIPQKSHFLIARFSQKADIFIEDLTLTENNTLAFKNPNREIVDKVGWGEAQDYETAPAKTLQTRESLGRKWDEENQTYFDRDDNSLDFEIQGPTPKEKNQSLPQDTNPPISPEPFFDLSKKVVINEIAWMGSETNSNHEWIELYNNSQENINLFGWQLKSSDGNPDIVFGISPKTATIATTFINDFYLLERNTDEATPELADWFGSFGRGLKNSGERLELYDNLGNLIDLVDCLSFGKWFAGDNRTKQTMERKDPLISGSDPKNWQTSEKPGGSPKK